MKPLAGFCVLLLAPVSATADVLSTADLTAQQTHWREWAERQTPLQITGRYRSRTGTGIHLQKLPLTLVPARGLALPERIRFGDRLTISGEMVFRGRQAEFRMNRIVNEGTDEDLFRSALKRLDPDDYPAHYRLAARYEQIAAFFEDRSLARTVAAARQTTFSRQRRAAAQDPERLWELAESGPGFDLAEAVRDEIRFEGLILLSRRPDLTIDELDQAITRLTGWFSGWKQPSSPLPERFRERFRTDPVALYGKSDENARRQMERLLYRNLRRRRLEADLKPDHSNALELARQVQDELPEERTMAQRLQNLWADFRLQTVESLSHRELEQLMTVLADLDRPDDIREGIDRWLQRQVRRFSARGLEGLVRTADEHLYAWDKWQHPNARDTAIDYLTEAWTAARRESPSDAEEIAARLERLGQSYLHDRWMSEADVRNLPDSDVERAAREGRVVPGMTPAQVRHIHGEPTRRIRMATSRSIEEIWLYGQPHTRRIAIYLTRPRSATPDAATVQSVFQADPR